MMVGQSRVRDLLNLSYVKRWVIAPMYREQSVAEHTFRVMVILWGLHDALLSAGHVSFPICDGLMDAMLHDVDEVYSGDVPGPHKDKSKGWKDPATMMNLEVAVKVADSLETWDWWRKHGDKGWGHDMKPAWGPECRDIKKIHHYCREWPELLEAAKVVVELAMGCGKIEMEGVFYVGH
jgi:hypothetical protein